MPISDNSNPVLTLEDFSAGYTELTNVRQANLQVNPGEIVGVFGPNGAGKSTLLKAVLNLVPLRSGKLELGGQEVNPRSKQSFVKLGAAISPEGRHIFPELSVYENLVLGTIQVKGPWKQYLDETLNIFPILSERLYQSAGTMSGGEQQQLAIARALMSKPKLLLLDEPSLGLSPLASKEVFSKIKQCAKLGLGVLVVDQNANAIFQLASRCFLMTEGTLTKFDTTNNPAEFQKNYFK